MCVGDDGGGASNISEGMLLVLVVLLVVVVKGLRQWQDGGVVVIVMEKKRKVFCFLKCNILLIDIMLPNYSFHIFLGKSIFQLTFLKESKK